MICLILTIYLTIPLLHLKGKFSRGSMMKRLNENRACLRVMPERVPQDEEERERIERVAMEERLKKAGLDPAETELPVPGLDGEITEEEFEEAVDILYYHVKPFRRKFTIGFILELVVSIAALIAFILTEDMRLPMILIDRWTPLMLLLLLVCWLLDLLLIRYRKKVRAEEEEEEERKALEEAAKQAAEEVEMK